MMRWINRHQRLWLLTAVVAAAVWFIGRGLYGDMLRPLVPALAAEALALWACYQAVVRENRQALQTFGDRCNPEPMLENSMEPRKLCRLLTGGGSPELLTRLQSVLERSLSDTLYTQVLAHWNLDRYLLDMGQAEEVRPYLEFVSANGSKLAIRREAAIRLRELETGR